MDLTLTKEQEQMKETVRDFLESKGGTDLARRQMDGDDVIDELWDELAAMDLIALPLPIEYEGLGDDLFYLSLILEEMGRYAMPGPYPETLAFAAPLLEMLGSDDQREKHLPSIADGEEQWSFAVYEQGTEDVTHETQLEAAPIDDGYRLNGTKTLVPYGKTVDNIVVAARTQNGSGNDGITLFIVDNDGPESRRLQSLDETRPVSEVVFDDLVVSEDARLGPLNGGGVALEHAMDQYIVSTSAMLVGAAERAVELSVEYGNTREQFGQPIGRFQAVKHRIADMWMDMRAGRSLVYYASWAVSNDKPDAGYSVSATKWFFTENFARIFGDDIQNHGGTGFTWDHDGHIYLKQAKSWESYFGTPEQHLERIADTQGI